MKIPMRFQNNVNAHLLGNMLCIKEYPLILAITGRPGMGKTFQLRKHLEQLDFKIFSVNAADLESEKAGAPAKLLKAKYVEASCNIAQNNPSVLIIDDIDTTVGEWEKNTGTVNHQGILAFLMHIADNPCYIEGMGNVNRVPVFFTGNKFEFLYEPLRRPGRTLRFDWEPTKLEKKEMICSCNSFIDLDIAEKLVDIYPEQPISFFSTLFSIQGLKLISDIASNASLKQLLTDSKYKEKIYQEYKDLYEKTDWINIIYSLDMEDDGDGGNNY